MKYLLTTVHSNLPPNGKTMFLSSYCHLFIGTEFTSEEYWEFGKYFKQLVEELNTTHRRTRPLHTHLQKGYFSARLDNTDKSLWLAFEPIKRTYPELMRDVLGKTRY